MSDGETVPLAGKGVAGEGVAGVSALSRGERALLRRLPLYQQIAEDLRARIERGELAPGEPLPSETEMITRYGVSRITVRHAVAALRASGLVVTEHGRASRVRPEALGTELVFTPTVTRGPDGEFVTWDSQGWADVEEPSRYRGEAAAHAGVLGVAPTELVFVHERQLMHATGTQVLYRAVIPFTTVEGTTLAEDPFVPAAQLYQALAESGHEIGWREEIRAVMPNPDQAATLDVPDGVPLLVHSRVTTDRCGRRLVLEETRLPAHRTVIAHEDSP
ncbi:MAG: GntR family transcriptional regulator [Actinomycetota bacterium]|nr:GntR family transcriptional regulator [Actinomycetota bacterium]